ncbi:MAG TPA: hypothetical protein VLF95_04760, partial [Vicinamibacteria bacterium]|nr:hypothetical protein [Vicinamibacteria bacterium]
MAARLVVTAIVLLVASAGVAQGAASPSGDVVIGRREIVHSAILNEDRPILVAVPPPAPPGLPASGSARFPVMVLLDGEWQFEHTVAAARFLARNGLVPPMIVAGVVNVDRGRDLMPRFEGTDLAEGPSDRFLGF